MFIMCTAIFIFLWSSYFFLFIKDQGNFKIMFAGHLYLIIKEKLVILIYSQLFTSSVLSNTYIFFFFFYFQIYQKSFLLLNFRSFDFWSHSFCCFYFWPNQLLDLVQVYSLYGKCMWRGDSPCSFLLYLVVHFSFAWQRERETFLSMQFVHLNKVREWMDQNVITKLTKNNNPNKI